MKATLKNYKQAPRKVRLIADLIRGMNVKEALSQLSFLEKKSAPAIKKLVASAAANAKNTEGVAEEDLFIKEVQVGKGITYKRFRPVSRGRAHPIHRHRSHVSVSLGTKEKPARPGKEEATTNKKEK